MAVLGRSCADTPQEALNGDQPFDIRGKDFSREMSPKAISVNQLPTNGSGIRHLLSKRRL